MDKIEELKRDVEEDIWIEARASEFKPILDHIKQLENKLKATEEACIEWKKKYEETNKS